MTSGGPEFTSAISPNDKRKDLRPLEEKAPIPEAYRDETDPNSYNQRATDHYRHFIETEKRPLGRVAGLTLDVEPPQPAE